MAFNSGGDAISNMGNTRRCIHGHKSCHKSNYKDTAYTICHEAVQNDFAPSLWGSSTWCAGCFEARQAQTAKNPLFCFCTDRPPCVRMPGSYEDPFTPRLHSIYLGLERVPIKGKKPECIGLWTTHLDGNLPKTKMPNPKSQTI